MNEFGGLGLWVNLLKAGLNKLSWVVFLLVAMLVGSTSLFSASAESFYSKVFGSSQPGYDAGYRKRKSRASKARSEKSRTQNKRGSRRNARSRKAYAIGRIEPLSKIRHRRSASSRKANLGRKAKRSSKRRKTYLVSKGASGYGKGGGATYRTMCVRRCDGFMYPVSFSTKKRHLKQDAGACAASCGMPADLYYYPNPGGEIEDMVSYKGRNKYKDLKNAFLFKSKFVADCRCKPEPWTETAKAQHKQYAKANIDPLKVLAASERKLKKRKKRHVKRSRRGRRLSTARKRKRYLRRRTSSNRRYYIRSARSAHASKLN